MSEMILRQWAMLRALPRAPRKISAQTLSLRLSELGFETTERTIQRDLNYLSNIFPLTCDDAKPKGWHWSEAAVSIELPGMDIHTALTLAIIEQSVNQLLPSITYRHMQPWFEQARKLIANAPAKLSDWKKKLHVVNHKMLFVVPKAKPQVQGIVYDGLLNGMQIEVTYQAISSQAPPKLYPVSPLGLIIRDRLVYLVCKVKEYKSPRLLALHRILAARLLETKAQLIPNLDLEEIGSKVLAIPQNDQPIRLQMLVSPLIRKYLTESPLSENQTVMVVDAENHVITADVLDSQQLRSWIRSLGREATVIKPEYLRNHLINELNQTTARYNNPVPPDNAERSET